MICQTLQNIITSIIFIKCVYTLKLLKHYKDFAGIRFALYLYRSEWHVSLREKTNIAVISS